MASSVEKQLSRVFSVDAGCCKEEICDLIRSQWCQYQLLKIPTDWHTAPTEKVSKCQEIHRSYWKDVERDWTCVPDVEYPGVRVDSYWSRVFEVKDERD